MNTNMRKLLQRLLAIALSFAVLPGLLPMTAFADSDEQFSLAPGGTYYFDLSAQGVPGTVNTALPDTSLKWVPFTYAGTVDAYSLDASASGVTSASGNATASDRSLFVADYNISHTVSWDALNGAGLIFGKAYNAGGAAFKLRSLSVGSGSNGQYDEDQRGAPETNEWDRILDKDGAYLKNWNWIFSWGQDTWISYAPNRVLRAYTFACTWTYRPRAEVLSYYGFRPALEILNPAALGADGLKTVTYDMDGNGTLGSGALASATVVYTGLPTLPEITLANGFTYTGTGTGTLGWYAGTVFHPAGTSPELASGTVLKAGLSADITGDFTDASFLAQVRTALGKDVSDPIYDTDDFASVTSLNVSDKAITSLAGIEYFTALTSLDCSFNELPSLDVSNNIALTSLDCSFNQITPLDVSDNTALTSLNCSSNQIPSLDVGKNIALTSLNCSGNQIPSLDVSKNTELASLDCSFNQLPSLDVSGNTALASLNCSGNLLPSLDVSNNTALTELYCGGNQLTELDLSKNTAMTELNCFKNQLGSLDLSSNTALTRLSCDDNQLTILDLSKNTALEELSCERNQLAVLNVSSNSALTRLYCGNNQLTELDMSSNIALTELYCGSNQLTALDVSNNTGLSELSCSLNQLSSLDVSNNGNLTWLECNYNYMPDESAITGLDEELTTIIFDPQHSGLPPVNAVKPSITGQPAGAAYAQNAPAAALSVTATITDSGTLSYQWYKNVSNNTTGGMPVGINSSGYTPPTNTVGTTWYYCVVTNTNPGATGDQTAAATSNTAAVTVNAPGNHGGSAPPATTTPAIAPGQSVTVTTPVTAAAGANGAVSADIPDKAITDAIAKAQADAKAQGSAANGIAVVLDVAMPQGASALTAALTENSLGSLVSAGVTGLEISGAPVSLSLDLEALKEIRKQSDGSVSITIAPATGLSAQAQALLGNRPVYSITLTYVDKDGKTQTVTGLGSGSATLSIPYTPGKNEAVGYLFGVYVDSNGNAVRIDGSAYDANAGAIRIPTGHFSVYGVGYTAPSARFTDIGSHWAKESIDYVVGRGLLTGTSNTAFAPDALMTRGMLVTVLGRLAGVDANAYAANSFTDVKADSVFRPYIEWAYQKGVIQGTGNGRFEPDRAVTREEIAVIFLNYAKAAGCKLPVTHEAGAYADESDIGGIYRTAVTAMRQAGIMIGENGNRFNPKAGATRAEASAMLQRYIRLTIDPAAAQGWTLNDDGRYMYYKDGKAFTGRQTVDGVKFFFNADGTLKTGWVKDGDDWRYYSGNKAVTGWLEIGGKWYYFYEDGSLAESTGIDGYEVDENGMRK